MPRLGRVWTVVTMGLILALVSTATAGDWPQILGPQRNGQATSERLLATWPEGGPQTVWSRPIGSGFAGVAVSAGRTVLFHRIGNELVAEALESATGKPLWSLRIPTRYVSGISDDNGPRCVPLIHGNRVYLMGPGGELACAAFDSGQQLWFINIVSEFRAQEGYFGCGSCPFVEEDSLILNVGGAGGAGIVAFDAATGAVRWKSTDEAASYSSPVAATIAGQRHLIFVTRLNVVSINPGDGAVRFRFPFGSRGPTVNAANPLVLGDHLFVSASYGVGAQWSHITDRAATKVWANDDVMSSQYATCVEHDGVLYGVDGRQDVGVARLRAFDPATGKVFWTQEGFGTASLVLADGKLLITKTSGELLLAEPSREAFRPISSAKVFNNTVQALAALADGLLYVRDTKTLKCLVVGNRSP